MNNKIPIDGGKRDVNIKLLSVTSAPVYSSGACVRQTNKKSSIFRKNNPYNISIIPRAV